MFRRRSLDSFGAIHAGFGVASFFAAVLVHRRMPRTMALVALLAVCLGGVSAHAARDDKPRPVGTITVRLTGFKDATGAARVALATSGQFLADAALRAASVPIKDGRAIAVF